MFLELTAFQPEISNHSSVFIPGLKESTNRSKSNFSNDTSGFLTANSIYLRPIDPKPPEMSFDATSDFISSNSSIINNSEYFELLFTLLKLGGGLGQRVWNIIGKLPPNETIEQGIRQSGGKSAKPDWTSLLDSKNPYRLFYAFRVILKISGEKSDDAANWTKAFFENGKTANKKLSTS